MPRAPWFGGVILLFFAAACHDSAVAPTIPKAFIRFVNALPDTLGIDLRAVDIVENSPYIATAFRDIKQAGYTPVESGKRHFREFLSNPAAPTASTVSTVLLDTILTLAAGAHYSLVHTGFARAGGIPAAVFVVIQDTLPSPPNGLIAVRVVNLGAGLGSLDIYSAPTGAGALPATPTFTNAAYTVPTGYVNLSTGATLFFRATAAGGGSGAPVLATGQTPVGVVGTSSLDPIPGSTISGSVFTVYVFPRSTVGSMATQFGTPGITVVPDIQLHTRP